MQLSISPQLSFSFDFSGKKKWKKMEQKSKASEEDK